MVKGVNKKVIEINNTENEFFEKIVLYVSPKISASNSSKVRKAVIEVIENLSGDYQKQKSLREILAKKKKRKRAVLSSLCAVCLIAASIILII